MQPETLNRSIQPTPTVHPRGFTPSEVYFGLNELGVAIWESLPPTLHSLDDLVATINTRFPRADLDTVRADAVEFIESLAESGLVEP